MALPCQAIAAPSRALHAPSPPSEAQGHRAPQRHSRQEKYWKHFRDSSNDATCERINPSPANVCGMSLTSLQSETEFCQKRF
jgi:hypothetical protein